MPKTAFGNKMLGSNNTFYSKIAGLKSRSLVEFKGLLESYLRDFLFLYSNNIVNSLTALVEREDFGF